MNEEQLACHETSLAPDVDEMGSKSATEQHYNDGLSDTESLPPLAGRNADSSDEDGIIAASPASPDPKLMQHYGVTSTNLTATEEFVRWQDRLKGSQVKSPIAVPTSTDVINCCATVVQTINDMAENNDGQALDYPDSIFTPDSFELFRITFEAACANSEAEPAKQRKVLLRQLRQQARAVLMRIPEEWSVRCILDHFQQLVQDGHRTQPDPSAATETVTEIQDDMDVTTGTEPAAEMPAADEHTHDMTTQSEQMNDSNCQLTNPPEPVETSPDQPSLLPHTVRPDDDELPELQTVADHYLLSRDELEEAISDYRCGHAKTKGRRWMSRSEQYDVLLSLCNGRCKEFIIAYDDEYRVEHALQLIAEFVARHGPGAHWKLTAEQRRMDPDNFRYHLFDELIADFSIALNEQRLRQQRIATAERAENQPDRRHSGTDSGHTDDYSNPDSNNDVVTDQVGELSDLLRTITPPQPTNHGEQVTELKPERARHTTQWPPRRPVRDINNTTREALLVRRLHHHRIMNLGQRLQDCERRERQRDRQLTQLRSELERIQSTSPPPEFENPYGTRRPRWQPAVGSEWNYRAVRGRRRIPHM